MKLLKENKYNLLSKIAKYGQMIIIVCIIVVPIFQTFAFGSPTPTGTSSTPPSNTGGVNVTTGITNPLGSSITDLPTFITALINIVLTIGIPIVVLAIIYAGFLFVTAQGNSEKLKNAKRTLLYTLIGAALLLGSFVIAKAIQGTVTDIGNTT